MQDDTLASSKKKLKILISIAVALVIGLFIFIFISNQTDTFALTGAEPTQGTPVAPEKSSVVLTFNKELPLKQGAGFGITIMPDVNFIYSIEDSTLTVKLTNVLLDDTTYSISVNNLYSVDEDLLSITAASIVVEFSEDSRGFIDALPYDSPGFIIQRVSEHGVYIIALKHPKEQRYEEAEVLMKNAGLDTSLFQVGSGALIEDTAPD